MKILFSQTQTFDSLSKFIFNLYDFRSRNKIKKEDVRVVLSYVPLQKNDIEPIKEDNIVIVEEKFASISQFMSCGYVMSFRFMVVW